MEEYLGIIKLFAGNFNPRGFLLCQGQLLSISQNTALFSILGTTYGGNGQTTFALPDFRGRVPIGQGQGPGLSPYSLGQLSGSENITLNTGQLPPHVHSIAPTPVTLNAVTAAGNATSPAGNYIAASRSATSAGFASTGTTAALNTASASTAASNSGVSGSGQPINTLQPYLVINYIICTEGLFPSRN